MTKRSPGFSPRLVSQKEGRTNTKQCGSLGRRCCHPCRDDPGRLSDQRVALWPHGAGPPWSPSPPQEECSEGCRGVTAIGWPRLQAEEAWKICRRLVCFGGLVDRPSGENGAFSQAIKPNWRRRVLAAVLREGADLPARASLIF